MTEQAWSITDLLHSTKISLQRIKKDFSYFESWDERKRKPCGSVCGTINPREVETVVLSLTLLKKKNSFGTTNFISKPVSAGKPK